MKNYYNPINSKYNLDTSISSDRQHYEHTAQSSKLYSSERLTHVDLPGHGHGHGGVQGQGQPSAEVSATQLYFNLNSSLDGLLSRIEGLKVEHTAEQKAPKNMKKLNINMDVSSFPMPNLSHTEHLSGKPLPPFIKPPFNIKKHHEQQVSISSKLSPLLSDDSKSVSPPTQSNNHYSSNNEGYYRSASTQNLGLKEEEFKIKVNSETKSHHYEEYDKDREKEKEMEAERYMDKQKGFNKNTLSKGLMSMPNINLKVSMQMSDQQYHHPNSSNSYNNTSQLDRIIQKQALETDIKKSIIFNQRVSLQDFQLGKNVGSGKFGDVHICRHRATGTMFALKKIFKSTILQYNMIPQFTRELKIHYKLSHPNIIKLYTHFDDEYHIFLLMQYAQGGILMDKLKCAEDVASKYVDQTIEALQYLHKLKIAHRDIKPENIVLQFNDVIKLCDFGWASFYENQMKTTFCGTLDYLSPEMKEGGQYDNSVDIWSIGVLTYELLTGNPPYRKELMLSMKGGVGPTKPGGRKVNWSVNYPSYLSPLSESFIRNLLKQNPEQRATLRFCSTHTFIKKYKENLEELPLFYQFNRILADHGGQSEKKNYLDTNWNPSTINYAFNNMQL